MATGVFSISKNGKKKWVATFNNDSNAQSFVNQQNRIYAGHLEFITERIDS